MGIRSYSSNVIELFELLVGCMQKSCSDSSTSILFKWPVSLQIQVSSPILLKTDIWNPLVFQIYFHLVIRIFYFLKTNNIFWLIPLMTPCRFVIFWNNQHCKFSTGWEIFYFYKLEFIICSRKLGPKAPSKPLLKDSI